MTLTMILTIVTNHSFAPRRNRAIPQVRFLGVEKFRWACVVRNTRGAADRTVWNLLDGFCTRSCSLGFVDSGYYKRREGL